MSWTAFKKEILYQILWPWQKIFIPETKTYTRGDMISTSLSFWFHKNNLKMRNKGLIKVHINTGLLKMIVRVLTTCHTQYTWDGNICIFLFNRTTLQVFVTYCTGALYVHPLWFYKHQHDNRVRSKLKCKHTKRLLTAVRRHLSKLRFKRRNA
jgi:hypothetical protein